MWHDFTAIKKRQNKCKRWCFVDCLPVHSYIHVPFLSIRTPLGTTLGWPPIPPYSIAKDQIHCWRVVCCPPNPSNQHWRRVPMPMAWSSVPGWSREMRERESLKVTTQRRKRISWCLSLWYRSTLLLIGLWSVQLTFHCCPSTMHHATLVLSSVVHILSDVLTVFKVSFELLPIRQPRPRLATPPLYKTDDRPSVVWYLGEGRRTVSRIVTM